MPEQHCCTIFQDIFILYGRNILLEELTEIAAFCREKNIQAATVYYKYWSEDVQEIFDKKGIRLYIYTVNDLKEAQYYMQEGAAGVCSDYLQDTMFN